MPDSARPKKLAHVCHERPRHDLFEFERLVDVMDHADVHIVRMEACEQIFERRLHLAHVARAHVLPVLPGRTDMPLDDPTLAVSFERIAQIRTSRRIRHPAVKEINAARFAAFHDRACLLQRAVHPFAAEANLAYLQAGLSEYAIPHERPLETSCADALILAP